MTTFHTIGSTVPLVVTVTLSLVGGVTLPSTTRIRWTIGEYAHLGPEVVRTDLFLVTVPAVTLLGVLVSRPLIARMSDRGAPRSARVRSSRAWAWSSASRRS